MVVIGITGGLKTGKSTVTTMFLKLGAKVLDADKVAHAVLDKKEIQKRIIHQFGKGVVKGGKIDRKKVAKVVFSDEKKLKKLEAIIHPQVEKEFTKKIKEQRRENPNSFLILDVPLLFEAGFNAYADYTILVKAPKNVQIKRAVAQLGITRSEALRRIKSQMPLKDKIRLADIIIDSNNDVQTTRKQVKTIWQKLQRRIKKRK